MKDDPVFAPYPYEHVRSLEDQITELAAHIHAATYRLLVLIHEYDDYDGWEGPGMKSCAHWLNWKCGISLGAAREKVRVAHALVDLPLISSAFRQGQISYSKVRAMTRVAAADNEEYLLLRTSPLMMLPPIEPMPWNEWPKGFCPTPMPGSPVVTDA